MKRSIVHEAALRYAELGYPVFPCSSGDKIPGTEHGYKDASTDPNQIDRWWTQKPSSNIGIPTDGLLVLDIDVEANWLNDDLDRQVELAVAPMALTPSGGRHYVYRQLAGKAWRNTQSEIAPHVDTRANGGLFVVPPSALPGRKVYQWAPGYELDVSPDQLPEPPDWLIALLDRSNPDAASSHSLPRVANRTTPGNDIPDGQRNGTLAKLAGSMRRVGMSQGEIQAALLTANVDRCKPPLAPREVQRIAESVARYEPDNISVALMENHWDQMMSGKKPDEFAFDILSSEQLDSNLYEIEYLVEGVMVRGQPMIIAAPKKTLKTTASVDLALSLGMAGHFLDRFPCNKAVRVGVMSAESGAATIQETARRIAVAKQTTLRKQGNVFWAFDVPQLDNAIHLAALRKFVVDHQLDVLILDPTYMMMVGLGQDASNLFVVGRYLKSLTDLIRDTGVTPVLCHHLRKGLNDPYEPAELENIAWAGFQEFIRQWVLINRRSKYDPDRGGHHELWMSFGGSAGHSSLWGVNVDEGTSQDPEGRHWNVDVITSSEAYAGRVDAAEEEKEHHRDQVRQQKQSKHRELALKTLCKFPEGETKKALRTAAKLNADNFQSAIELLVEEGLAEACEIEKVGRKFDGYRPIGASDQAGQTGPN
ncbi:MAG: hypothetical protein DWH91_14430 [Planctomycetota bacterium]|nr:MAG: hypothetical protein DWH91_14430 [Planctomycetota bacterium]